MLLRVQIMEHISATFPVTYMSNKSRILFLSLNHTSARFLKPGQSYTLISKNNGNAGSIYNGRITGVRQMGRRIAVEI
jgi:hypothetical protein